MFCTDLSISVLGVISVLTDDQLYTQVVFSIQQIQNVCFCIFMTLTERFVSGGDGVCGVCVD